YPRCPRPFCGRAADPGPLARPRGRLYLLGPPRRRARGFRHPGARSRPPGSRRDRIERGSRKDRRMSTDERCRKAGEPGWTRTTEDERLLSRMPEGTRASDFTHTDPWRVFRIMGEFVEGFDTLATLGPAVSIFGSARILPD